MSTLDNDLYIDDSALDVEWLTQPDLMKKYTRLQADAKREYELQKEALAVVRANLDKHIRKFPDQHDLDKVTNETVNSAIMTSEKYRKANFKLIDAQHDMQLLAGAVASVEMRKSALENLSRLLAMNYFAGPKTPRNLTDEVARSNRQTRVDSGIKIKRKRK